MRRPVAMWPHPFADPKVGLLRPPAGASQAHEVDQPPGAAQRGTEAADPVVRIFPNTAACLRLTRALAAEIHEDWIEATRYINMDLLREQEKERAQLGTAA